MYSTLVVATISIVVTLLWFQDEINSYFKPHAAPPDKPPVAQTTQTLKLPSALSNIAPYDTTSGTDRPGKEFIAEGLPTVTERTTRNTEDDSVTAPEDTAETAVTSKPKTEKTPVKSTTTLINTPKSPSAVTLSPTKTETQNQDGTAASSVLKDEQWLLTQNPDYFTLQLVAGHHKATIMQFIEKHHLATPQLAYYYTHRDGKNWHNLLYGVFSDRQSAQQASKQLPKELAKLKPWVRTIESIQIDIYRAQQ
jgi:DamX protein